MRWLALPLLALLATPASAADMHLRFEAHWGGLHAADFALSMADLSQADGTATHNELRLRTRGVLDFLARMKLTATSGATLNAQPPYLRATGYAVDYTSRRRDRILEIDFSEARARTRVIDRKKGGKVLAASDDKDDFAEADIPQIELENVMDPLLGLAEALRRTRAHLNNNGPSTFHLRGFDGKRRFDMDGEFFGPATRTIAEQKMQIYRLRLTARPVAGFKSRHRMMWNDSAFDLYLSRDGRFVPLQIVSIGHGPVLTMIEECATPCALPDPD